MLYRLHGIIMVGVSLVYNTLYWIWHLPWLWITHDKMKLIKATLKTKADVRLLMRQFIWTEDRFIDWQPWIITLFHKQFKDDCDGAAVLAKWALHQVGVESRIIRLWKKGSTEGHSVCVSNDNKIIISNDDYSDIDKTPFPQNVYDYFGNHFNIMT